GALAGYAMGIGFEGVAHLGSAAADDAEVLLCLAGTVASELAAQGHRVRTMVPAADRRLVEGLMGFGFRVFRAGHYMVRGGARAPAGRATAFRITAAGAPTPPRPARRGRPRCARRPRGAGWRRARAGGRAGAAGGACAARARPRTCRSDRAGSGAGSAPRQADGAPSARAWGDGARGARPGDT